VVLPFPSVGIKSQYTVTSDDQYAMMQTLVNYGPLSVGICGTDPLFMYYAGGILNFPSCCTTQNHAILIVGYGNTTTTTTICSYSLLINLYLLYKLGHDNVTDLDYWIAQNSWGTRWGEKGYIRILR
jgi:hypothetical protein